MMLLELTVIIDGIDEPQSNVSVVVGHQHHIKQLLTVWVNLPQSCIHSLQGLGTRSTETLLKMNPKSSTRAAGSTYSLNSDLDEGEGRPWAERLGFVRHLMLDVLLHTLAFIDVLLLLHVEEDPR